MLQYFIIIGEGVLSGGGGGERRGIINRLERDVEGWGGGEQK